MEENKLRRAITVGDQTGKKLILTETGDSTSKLGMMKIEFTIVVEEKDHSVRRKLLLSTKQLKSSSQTYSSMFIVE